MCERTSVSHQQDPGGRETMEPVLSLAVAPLDALSIIFGGMTASSVPNFSGSKRTEKALLTGLVP